MKTLTSKEKKCLKFIEDYGDVHGFCPNIREIGEYMGQSSTSSTYNMLLRIELKGYIVRPANKARAITIVKEF